jgi:exopolysaccharide biosynthesis polyprenyl glycosylphosphotransferase
VPRPILAECDWNVGSAAVARTIPGLRHAHSAVPGKPAPSVGVEARGETWLAHDDDRENRATLGRSLASFVLPLPADAQNRSRVLLNIAITYSIVFVSLAIVQIPSAIHAGPSSLLHAAAIVWRDLLASHLGHLLLYGALITSLSYAEGLFGNQEEISTGVHILMIAKVGFWATLVFGIGLHRSGTAMDLFTLISLATLITAGLVVIGVVSRRTQLGAISSSQRAKNVLIVGTTQTAREIARHLALARNQRRIVKGFVSRFQTGEPAVLGTVDDLARIARAEFIDEIIVASGRDRQLAERAVAEALHNHLDVSVVPELFADWPTRLSLQTVGRVPLIAVHEEPIPRLGLLVKRISDVVLSAIGLLLMLPLMIVIAGAIKFESAGTIFYGALRAGKKGRTFECYKFRTMYADADRNKDELRVRNERRGPTFKIANDPRITSLGRVLRRYSLDELPQLWNVLSGTMSLVGPRPHPLDDYLRYALEDRRRLDVSPGITGLWQVSARTDSSFATNMALDLEYIENWSLGMDMVILLKTIPAVLAGTGA